MFRILIHNIAWSRCTKLHVRYMACQLISLAILLWTFPVMSHFIFRKHDSQSKTEIIGSCIQDDGPNVLIYMHLYQSPTLQYDSKFWGSMKIPSCMTGKMIVGSDLKLQTGQSCWRADHLKLDDRFCRYWECCETVKDITCRLKGLIEKNSTFR